MTVPLLQFGLLLAVFIGLLGIGVPVFFAMGLASLAFILSAGGQVPLNVLASSLVEGVDSFAFLAIPFFLLAGEIMNTGGITRRLIAFSSALVGHIRGGLSHVVVISSMVFSGVSGSAVADASAIGGALIPAMKEDGYPRDYAAAVVAAASTMGPIFPPSMAFVIYALLTDVSVGRLFLAGAVPGLLMCGWLLATTSLMAHRRGYSYSARASLARIWRTSRDALLALGMPVIILGGIIGGLVTPTESGVIAVVYATAVTTLVYRELKLNELWGILARSAAASGLVLLMIAASGTFSWLVANMAIGDMLVAFFTSLTDNRWVMLLIINVFFLLWGLALEPPVVMATMVPLLLPMAKAYDIDLVHLGVVMVLNLMIGQLTPPSGLVTFLTAQIAEAQIAAVFREEVPFAIALVIVLALVTFIPSLALWLPDFLTQN